MRQVLKRKESAKLAGEFCKIEPFQSVRRRLLPQYYRVKYNITDLNSTVNRYDVKSILHFSEDFSFLHQPFAKTDG